MSTLVLKANVTDDAAPDGGTSASRIFSVPAFVNAKQADRVVLRVEILTAAGNSVLDGTCTAVLWLKILGVWTSIGTLASIPRGHIVSFPFGGLTEENVDGYVQLTTIAGTAAHHVSFTIDVVDTAETEAPRNARGIPLVAIDPGSPSSALPSGAATSANQATEIASLASIDGKLTVTNAKDFATQTTLAAMNTRDALEITESPTATLAYTKATTTDDAAPGDATAVQATLTQSARPSTSVVAFVQLVNGGGVAVAGANCSVRAWLRVTLPGGATYTYIDLGRRDGVYGNKLVTWAFGAIRGSIELFFQVTNVQGAPTSIKVYAMPGADIPGAYDPATGAIRSMDILVRGGEQNAIGSHMTSVRVTQSPDGAAAFDDPAALEASSVTKAGPGCLYGFVATNTNAAVRYLQFYDLTAVPADTAVPKLVFALQPGVTMVVQIPPERRYFATGICWSVSTTIATKTIGAAETWCNVAYG